MRAAALAIAAASLVACGGASKAKPPVAPVAAPRVDKAGLNLAIYRNSALVRDLRELELTAGVQPLRWDRLASLIDATSLRVFSHTDKGTRVIDGTVRQPVLSGETLLAHAIGGEIAVTNTGGEVRGILRAYDATRLIIETDGVPRLIYRDTLRSLSVAGDEGVSSNAVADWRVDGAGGGKQLVEVSYRTTGIDWAADYTVIVDPDGRTVDFAGWATIRNESGVAYQDALIDLMSEDGAPPPGASQPGGPRTPPPAQGAAAVSSQKGRVVASVGPASLRDHQTTRVALVVPRTVTGVRRLVFDSVGEEGIWHGEEVRKDAEFATNERTAVEDYLEFRNDTASGLGRQLPPGTTRVFQRETGGGLSWLGEDTLAASEPGDPVRLRLAPAAGLAGKRKQLEFTIDNEVKRMVEEIEVVLTNTTDAATDVVVLERLARGDSWSIPWASDTVAKDDSRTIRFNLTVPAKGESKVRYRVIYTWL
jgi:hypothetical protein